MTQNNLRICTSLASLLSLLALLLTGCAPAAAPVAAPAAAPPTALVADTGLSTLHFFYTDW